MSIGKFLDDVVGLDPSGGGIVGSVGNFADDVLGLDPSGEGLIGSIRDNPEILGAGLLGLGLANPSFFAPGALARSAFDAGVSGLGFLANNPGAVLGLTGLLGSQGAFGGGQGSNQSGDPTIPQNPNLFGVDSTGLIGQSGLDYARQVSGGIPFANLVQPGMEFSLNEPMAGQVAMPIGNEPTPPPPTEVPPAPISPDPQPDPSVNIGFPGGFSPPGFNPEPILDDNPLPIGPDPIPSIGFPGGFTPPEEVPPAPIFTQPIDDNNPPGETPDPITNVGFPIGYIPPDLRPTPGVGFISGVTPLPNFGVPEAPIFNDPIGPIVTPDPEITPVFDLDPRERVELLNSFGYPRGLI